MDNLKFLSYLFLLCGIFSFLSCNGNDEDTDGEQSDHEYIQGLTISLTPSSGGQPFIMTYLDSDGPGNIAPVVSAELLPIQTSYTATVQITDENGDVINYDKDDTQIFFAVSSGLDLTIEYSDTDSNGYAVGFQNQVTSGNLPTSGVIDIVVKTEVDKPNAGVATNANGDTELEFTISVSTL